MTMFREYGTVAFDAEMIRRMIRVGRVRVDEEGNPVLGTDMQPIVDPYPGLDLTLWFLMVPEAYKLDAARAVQAVGPRWINEKLTDGVIQCFIADLQAWIRANVEPK